MRDQRRKAEAYHIVARMAHLATDLAWHFDGNMGHVARLIGGEMMAEHRDADLVQQYFAQTGFPEMARLMEAVRHGVPVEWMATVTCLRPCSMETILARTHTTMSFGNGWWRTLRGDEL